VALVEAAAEELRLFLRAAAKGVLCVAALFLLELFDDFVAKRSELCLARHVEDCCSRLWGGGRVQSRKRWAVSLPWAMRMGERPLCAISKLKA
jgi:hypothetical protein